MSNGPQMFHINPETEETQALTEVADLGLRERKNILDRPSRRLIDNRQGIQRL